MSLSKKRLQRLQAKHADDATAQALFACPASMKVCISAEGTKALTVQLRSWALQLLALVDDLAAVDPATQAGVAKGTDTLHAILTGSLNTHGSLAAPSAGEAEGEAASPPPAAALHYAWNPSVLSVKLGIVPVVAAALRAAAVSPAPPRSSLALRMRGQLLLAQASSWTGNKVPLVEGGALGAAIAALGARGTASGAGMVQEQLGAVLLLFMSCADAVLPPTTGDGAFGILHSAGTASAGEAGAPAAAAAVAPDTAPPTALAVRSRHQLPYVSQRCLPVLTAAFKQMSDATSRLYVALTLANLLACGVEEVASAVTEAGGAKLLSLVLLTDAFKSLPQVPAPLMSCETLCGVLGLLTAQDSTVLQVGLYTLRAVAQVAQSSGKAAALRKHLEPVLARDLLALGWAPRSLPDVLAWMQESGAAVPLRSDFASDEAADAAWEAAGPADSKVKEAASAAADAWQAMWGAEE